jgi:two-component system response regulator YesN
MKIRQNRRLWIAWGAVSVILFLLVFAAMAISYQLFTKQLKEQLISTNMELIGQQNHKLALTLQLIDKTAIQFMKNDAVVRFFNERRNAELNINNEFHVVHTINQTASSIEYIFSMDLYSYTKQRLLTGNMISEINENVQDFGWIPEFEQEAGLFKWLTTRKIALNARQSVYRNVVTLVRSYPLVHQPGGRKGAVAVNVKEDLLYSLIKNTEPDDRGETFVLDGEGVIALHDDKTRLGKDISELPFVRGILGRDAASGYFAEQVNGQPSWVFYMKSEYTGWLTVRVIPASQMSQQMTVIRNTLIGLSLLLFVIAAASTAFAGRWTYLPINRFVLAVRGKLTSQQKAAEAEMSGRRYTDDFHYLEHTVQGILTDREELSRQVSEGKPYIKLQLVADLLSGRRKNPEALQTYEEMLNLRLFGSRFVVMSIELDNKGAIASPRDVRLYTYALCNAAEELVNAESKGIAAELEHGKAAVIMSFDEGDDDQRYIMRAVTVADLLKQFVQEYFRRTITIGIGNVAHTPVDIAVAYRESSEALRYKLVLGGNAIITMDDIVSEQSPRFYKLFASIDTIVASVKAADGEMLKTQLARWFVSFAEQQVPPEVIAQLIVQCLMRAATDAVEIGVEAGSLFPEQDMYDHLNQYEMLNRYEQLDELERFALDRLTGLIRLIREKRSHRERNDMIDQSLIFIQTHYMRSDLSLNLLASEFGLSVPYLSKMFKEQVEINFTEYVMEIRLAKAKELLSATDGKVRDIAEQVGYTNVNSFVRIFKKMTGLTPSEYRERNPAIRDGA